MVKVQINSAIEWCSQDWARLGQDKSLPEVFCLGLTIVLQ